MNSGALRPLFDPNGIILVGVGRKQESIGRKLLRNITTSGYSKPIHIIHPSADVIDGYPVISDLSNLPYGVDLLAVITPPQDVH